MKKKLLSLALAAVMVMSLSATALAATYTESTDGDGNPVITYTDEGTITITKEYTLTNEDTTSPEEIFYITQIGNVEITESDATADDITGDLTISNVTFAEGAAGDETNGTGTFTVTLPTYSKVGVYTYTLKETVGTTAGVTYRTDTITLVVTVIEQNGLVRVAAVHCENGDGDKTSSFAENEYSAGSLDVSKSVTGNLGDKDKEFEVRVTFTAPTDDEGNYLDVNSTISYTEDEVEKTISPTWTNGTASVTINLKDDETITFTNVPYGVTYTVLEADYTTSDGYDNATYSLNGGTASTNSVKDEELDNASESVAIVNNKTGDVDTGINLDTLPYIMILAVVFAGTAYMVVRKRMSDTY